jgi:hypothetical protein
MPTGVRRRRLKVPTAGQEGLATPAGRPVDLKPHGTHTSPDVPTAGMEPPPTHTPNPGPPAAGNEISPALTPAAAW